MNRWWKELGKRINRMANRAKATWSAKSPKEPWDWSRTLLGLEILGLLALAAVLTFGWAPAERGLRQYVAQRRSRPMTYQQVVLVNPPAWLPTGFKLRLQKLISDQLTSDPMDEASLQRAQRALMACGWIEKVHRLEYRGSRLIAQLEYRTPVAAVECVDGYALIDVKSQKLPGVYRIDQLAALNLPKIQGVTAARPLKDAMVWPGQEIPAALGLLGILADQSYFNQIAAVEIARRANQQLTLNLITSSGMVRWGLPPDSLSPIEPTAAVKKEWLTRIYLDTGSIDGGGRVVEVFGAAPYYRAAEHDASALPTTDSANASARYSAFLHR